MESKYYEYIHMRPKPADKVPNFWRASHLIVFVLIFISSGIATKAMYEILLMFGFHCIIYAKVTFQKPYSDLLESVNNETTVYTVAGSTNDYTETKSENSDARNGRKLLEYNWNREPVIEDLNLTARPPINNTGFINLRRTTFATIYMCDLMLFAPLASSVLSILLGILVGAGGRGGTGSPGDLFPNFWIYVYPFMALCGFMVLFCFISNNLYHSGLQKFCNRYSHLTGNELCSAEMDQFTIQFTKDSQGPPQKFYYNYILGSVSMKAIPFLWGIQTFLYVLRIICVTDFSIYLTRISIIEGGKLDGNDNDSSKLITIKGWKQLTEVLQNTFSFTEKLY